MKKFLFTCFFTLLFLHGSSQVPPTYKAIVYDTAATGYYFLCPFINPFNRSYHMIMDAKGNLVYYKYLSQARSYDFKMQPNNMISYFASGKFFLMDSTFFVRDTIIAANGYQTNLHDLQILPNGHYLLLANEYVTMNLSSYNYFSHNGSPGSATASVQCSIIQEFDQNKNLVYEWHVKDHIPFDSVDPFFLNSPTNVDWSHTNAIEIDNDGNYLISSRHFNEITKINRTTGAVMWRLGGNYNQFTFLNDTVRFYGQHDIRRLSNGNITLFDDANHTVPHGARALEYHLDETNMTAERVWAYVYDSAMYSNATGNNQRLANSNSVIDYGDISPGKNICFNVVRQDNSKVFELTFDDTLFSYRSFAYPEMPWSFHRPQIACFDSSGSHYLDAGAGYASYQWSNGGNTRIIPITATDTFSVFVPYGQGGYISSEKYIVTDINNPCGLALSVHAIENEKSIQLFPNPASDVLNITIPEQIRSTGNIVISDLAGRIISQTVSGNQFSKNITLDVSFLEDGLYFISMGGCTAKFTKEK